MKNCTAPDALLDYLNCWCKGACNTKKSSCHNAGLICRVLCINCNGISCENRDSPTLSDEVISRIRTWNYFLGLAGFITNLFQVRHLLNGALVGPSRGSRHMTSVLSFHM